LRDLNSLSDSAAEAELLKCCGSLNWARSMTSARPFSSQADLLAKAEQLWWSLSSADWLEAFRAHPKIGEHKAATQQSAQAQDWSAQEQSGIARAADEIKNALAAGNSEYENRFGFIYIVCATGRTPDEMLSILNDRLSNDPDTELRMAAAEQAKIIRLRLEKLLNT